jgi:hypothetical protein
MVGPDYKPPVVTLSARWSEAQEAAVVAGCGNGAGSSSSDQQVGSLSATASDGSAITVTGLPIDLGTISVSGSG